MSVRTAADEHLAKAKEHIESAVKELQQIVVERAWGHDEFKDTYRAKIRARFLTLLDMRDDW